MPSKTPSMRLLNRLVAYKPKTGALVWRARPVWIFPNRGRGGRQMQSKRWNTRYAGREAFASINSDGYKKGAILGFYYLSHRLAWALHHDEWPDSVIDHINGNKQDNRISNLRNVAQTENAKNRPLQSNNRSGSTGVCWRSDHQAWAVGIGVSGKTLHIGTFKNLDDAITARKAAEAKYGYHANHGTPRSAFVKEIVLKEIGDGS